MLTWEEVKHLPDNEIIVYSVNKTIKGPLPGIIRQIHPIYSNPYREYDFVRLIDMSPIDFYKKDELMFWRKDDV